MPRSAYDIARQLRDAAGAATLTVAIFGAPIALALMQLDVVPSLDTVTTPTAERQLTFMMAGPPPFGEAIGSLTVAQEPPPPVAPPQPKALVDPVIDPIADAQQLDTAAEGPDLAQADPPLAAPDETSARPGVHRHPLVNLVDPRTLRARSQARQARSDRSTSTSTRRGRKCQDATGDIRAIDERSFEVERSLVNLYVNDLELAQSLASVAWHRDERGKIDGFRIRRIRCGTVLHQAGFRNGDVVHSVNGKKIRTVFGAIAAYRKLKRKEHLRIDATDGTGQTKELRYRIS